MLSPATTAVPDQGATVRTPLRARRAGWVWLLVALGTALSGCSSDGTTADETAVVPPATGPSDVAATDEGAGGTPSALLGLELTATGASPMVELRAADGATFHIVVDASDISTTTIDGATTTAERVASYELEGESGLTSTGTALVVSPTIISLTSDQPVPDPADIDAWRIELDAAGIVTEIDRGEPGTLTSATAGLLTSPGLRLAVPDEPVGIGAGWRYPLDRAGATWVTVKVTGMADDRVEAETEFTAENDDGQITMTARGWYSRSSLVALDVQVETTMSFRAAVSDNGDVVEMSGTERSTRRYEEGPAT